MPIPLRPVDGSYPGLTSPSGSPASISPGVPARTTQQRWFAAWLERAGRTQGWPRSTRTRLETEDARPGG